MNLIISLIGLDLGVIDDESAFIKTLYYIYKSITLYFILLNLTYYNHTINKNNNFYKWSYNITNIK